MASPLHGGCQCGRNSYIVLPPPDATAVARVLFDAGQTHRSSLASPLPAYLRIPLSWYHSTTTPFFEDETPAMIHRVYEQSTPGTFFTQRRFCGFCGTPLSYWSETPKSEANFIRLVVGSLQAQDLNRLDEWDAIGEDEDESSAESSTEGNNDNKEEEDKDASFTRPVISHSYHHHLTSATGLPWLDRFLEGSRLDRQLLHQQHKRLASEKDTHIRRHDVGSATNEDGTVKVEWEVVEWTEGDNNEGVLEHQPSPAKRQKSNNGENASGSPAMDVEA